MAVIVEPVRGCEWLIGIVLAGVVASSAAPAAPEVTLRRLPAGGLQPEAAVDAQGTTHVIYFQGVASHGDLFYARLDRRGLLGRAIRVNSQPGSAVATGTIRGPHITIGRNGLVHVAWHGSTPAGPKAGVLYTRMNAAGTGFEPERNVAREAVGLDSGTVAADAAGHVYVVWHAGVPGGRGEATRRLWVARSADDGQTFAAGTAASGADLGACGCCGVAAMAGPRGGLYLLYRSAAEGRHRDAYLLRSRDHGMSFTADRLQAWNVAACPMSTFSLASSTAGVLAAWETNGQVYWTRINPASGAHAGIIAAPGPATDRKHPVIAGNARGETLLVWTEGTGWNKGGSLAWQLFDGSGRPTGGAGRAPGLPTWGMAAVAPRADGGFVVLY